jgi:hypothetical protein
MNKKLLTLFAASAIALLFSCSDDVGEESQLERGANLYLTVQKALSGEPASGATAQLIMSDITVQETTSEDGEATLRIKAGSHTLEVEMAGYAKARKFVETAELINQGRLVVADAYENVQLYSTSTKTGLKGLLYYTNARGESVPMEGVPMRIDFPSYLDLAQSSYDCSTTNSKGEYSCPGLPAVGSKYSLYALGTEIDGVAYPAVKIDNVPLRYDIESNNLKRNYENGIRTFTLMETYKELENSKAGEPLTLIFSEAVDTAQFQNSMINVSQAAKLEWLCTKDICKELKLTPLPKWNVGTSTITFNGLKGFIGNPYYGTFNLKVLGIDISGEQVKGLGFVGIGVNKPDIDYPDKAAKISWAKIEGATGYEVFVKVDSTNAKLEQVANFELVTCNPTESNNKLTCEMNINSGNSINGRTNQVIVRAKNSDSYSKFSEPLNIAAKDDKKSPTYATWAHTIIDPCHETGDNCKLGYYFVQGHNATGGIIEFYEFNKDLRGAIDTRTFETRYLLTSTGESKLHMPEAYDKELTNIPAIDNNAKTVISYGRIFFNKPMDTTVALTQDERVVCELVPGNNSANACKKLILKAKWNNSQNIGLTVTTTSENDVNSDININWIIRGLKGKNGEDFVANPGGSTPIKEVRINFKADKPADMCVLHAFDGGCPGATEANKKAYCELYDNDPDNLEPGCYKYGCDADLFVTDSRQCRNHCQYYRGADKNNTICDLPCTNFTRDSDLCRIHCRQDGFAETQGGVGGECNGWCNGYNNPGSAGGLYPNGTFTLGCTNYDMCKPYNDSNGDDDSYLGNCGGYCTSHILDNYESTLTCNGDIFPNLTGSSSGVGWCFTEEDEHLGCYGYCGSNNGKRDYANCRLQACIHNKGESTTDCKDYDDYCERAIALDNYGNCDDWCAILANANEIACVGVGP